VRKVSAIVAEGERYTTTITDHRRWTSISEGVTTTALAARLARPAPPRSSGCALLATIMAGALGLVVALVVGCGAGIIVSGYLRAGGLSTILLPLAGAILLPLLLVVVGSLARGALSSRASVADLRWQRAVARWETLFYCGRCDGVFAPGDVGLAPATRMRDVPGVSRARV
jgi:hypothetical protein